MEFILSINESHITIFHILQSECADATYIPGYAVPIAILSYISYKLPANYVSTTLAAVDIMWG